jgi:hypothetical protein
LHIIYNIFNNINSGGGNIKKKIKLIIEVRTMTIKLMMTMGKIVAKTNTNKEKNIKCA